LDSFSRTKSFPFISQMWIQWGKHSVLAGMWGIKERKNPWTCGRKSEDYLRRLCLHLVTKRSISTKNVFFYSIPVIFELPCKHRSALILVYVKLSIAIWLLHHTTLLTKLNCRFIPWCTGILIQGLLIHLSIGTCWERVEQEWNHPHNLLKLTSLKRVMI